MFLHCWNTNLCCQCGGRWLSVGFSSRDSKPMLDTGPTPQLTDILQTYFWVWFNNNMVLCSGQMSYWIPQVIYKAFHHTYILHKHPCNQFRSLGSRTLTAFLQTPWDCYCQQATITRTIWGLFLPGRAQRQAGTTALKTTRPSSERRPSVDHQGYDVLKTALWRDLTLYALSLCLSLSPDSVSLFLSISFSLYVSLTVCVSPSKCGFHVAPPSLSLPPNRVRGLQGLIFQPPCPPKYPNTCAVSQRPMRGRGDRKETGGRKEREKRRKGGRGQREEGER